MKRNPSFSSTSAPFAVLVTPPHVTAKLVKLLAGACYSEQGNLSLVELRGCLQTPFHLFVLIQFNLPSKYFSSAEEMCKSTKQFVICVYSNKAHADQCHGARRECTCAGQPPQTPRRRSSSSESDNRNHRLPSEATTIH